MTPLSKAPSRPSVLASYEFRSVIYLTRRIQRDYYTAIGLTLRCTVAGATLEKVIADFTDQVRADLRTAAHAGSAPEWVEPTSATGWPPGTLRTLIVYRLAGQDAWAVLP